MHAERVHVVLGGCAPRQVTVVGSILVVRGCPAAVARGHVRAGVQWSESFSVRGTSNVRSEACLTSVVGNGGIVNHFVYGWFPARVNSFEDFDGAFADSTDASDADFR